MDPSFGFGRGFAWVETAMPFLTKRFYLETLMLSILTKNQLAKKINRSLLWVFRCSIYTPESQVLQPYQGSYSYINWKALRPPKFL
jgi:hypothetical protein